MNKIKLENIVQKSVAHEHKYNALDLYCPECGQAVKQNAIATTYVCSGCRHIVLETDKYCRFCGGSFEGDITTEHHIAGRLSDDEFQAVKTAIENKTK